MKTVSKFILTATVIGMAFIIKGYSQSPASPQPENTTIFLGHALKNEDAIKSVSTIIIGKFISLGDGSTDSPGESFYQNAEIQVIMPLKGTVSGNLTVSYSVKFLSKNGNENSPIIGNQYIIFLQENSPQRFSIKKLLPATDANIAKVKALIAAAPVGK